MKFWLFVSLAVVPGFAGQPHTVASPIALYTEFEQAPPAAVLEGIKDEVSLLMGPLGMHFQWRALADARGDDAVPELAVVHFKGRCNVDGLTSHTRSPGALGWTHISDGAVLPFSDVDCSGIRGFLAAGLFSIPAPEREIAYGRALGRVLAHELYHVFMNTQHHAARGAAKPTYTVEDLLNTEFRFE